MTPRNRILIAVALVALLAIPVSIALAGRQGSTDVATATGTSITSTTKAPTTTAAPTTSAAITTTAPTSAVPSTEESTVAPPTTAAPVVTTAKPAPVPATAPPATTPVTFPPLPPPVPTAAPVDVKTALAQAAAIKKADDDAAKAAAEAAAAIPIPPLDPEPSGQPDPEATDDPLQQLSPWDQQYLACVRWRESRNDYTVVNRSSGAGGAYQFLQTTWNNTAAHLGRGDLIGLRPNWASVHDQDMLAVHLLQWYGRSPWAGPGC